MTIPGTAHSTTSSSVYSPIFGGIPECTLTKKICVPQTTKGKPAMGDPARQCSSCLLESSCGPLLLQDLCRCLWEGYLGLSTWQSFCNLSCFNYFGTTCGRRRLLSPGPHVYYLESLGRSDSDGTYMLLPKPRMDVEVFITFSGEWTSGETVTKGTLWYCLPKRSVPKAEITKLKFLLSASLL